MNMGDQNDKVVVKPEGVANLMPACVVCTYQCNKVHGDVHRQAEKYDPDRTWPYFIKGVRRSSLHDAAPSLLCIPAAFVEAYPHTFDGNNSIVTLEGPSRNRWQVKVVGKGNPQFSSGWRAFAYDHDLKEGDQLHFNLVKVSHFVVDIFNSDGKVRKSCRHAVNSGKYAGGSGLAANHNSQAQDQAGGRGARKRKITDSEYHAYAKWGDMDGGHPNYTTIARRCKTTNRRASYNEYPIAMGGGAGPSVSPKSGKLWECHKDDGGKEVVTILDSDDDEIVRSIPPQATQGGRTSSKLERLVEYMKKEEDAKLHDDIGRLKRTAKPEVRGDDDRQTMQAANARSQAGDGDTSTEEDTDVCGDKEISEDGVSAESNEKKKKKKVIDDPLRKFSRIFDTERPKKLKRTPVIGLQPEPALQLAETALNPAEMAKTGGGDLPVNLKVKEEKIDPTIFFQIHEVEDSVLEEDEQEETLVSTQSHGKELEKTGKSNLAFNDVAAETNNLLNGGESSVTQLITENVECATTSKANSQVVKSAVTAVEASSGVELEVVLGQYDETQKHLKFNIENESAKEGMQDSGREASIDFTFDTVVTNVKLSDAIPREANQDASDVHPWKHPAIAHVTAAEYNQGIQEDDIDAAIGKERQVQSLKAPEHILNDSDNTHNTEAGMNVSQKDISHSNSSANFHDQEADHGNQTETMLAVTESNKTHDKNLTKYMNADPISSNEYKHVNIHSIMTSIKSPNMTSVVGKDQSMETTSNLAALPNMPQECGTGGTTSSKEVEFDKSFILVSKRRTVTDAEKFNAVKAGQSWAKKLQNPTFVAVMKGSEVYREFQLSIPFDFVKKAKLPGKEVGVTLVCGDRPTTCKALWLGDHPKSPRLNSKGWMNFSCNHFLEEGDVCVFELFNRTTFRIGVHIFRVAPLSECGVPWNQHYDVFERQTAIEDQDTMDISEEESP